MPATLDTRTILNLGCGRVHREDAVNVDRTSRVLPDVVHDLDVVPWPFASDRFSGVYALDVIEHLRDVPTAMEELHRVCRHDAFAEITVPHFSCANAFKDPTHRHFFAQGSFAYFDETHPLSFYSDARFRVERANIIFHPTWTNKLVARLANAFPAQYEERWAWIFPAWFLSVRLRVKKG